jgi:genome maintenance exonuclease 1
MLNNGKMLHSNIEAFLRGTPLDEIVVADGIAGHWKSLKHVLPLVQDIRVIESRVVHPELMYCGIVDCVAVYK